jgi:FkbM family methyltransferase
MVMEEYDLKAIPQTDRVKSAYEAVLFEGKKPVIIDCGGHVGLSAVWFANRYPKAIVYVVEPDESNLKMLEINTAFYSNIVPIHGAVWGHRCNVMISNPDAGNASFRIREEESSSDQCAPLAGYTIDEISEFGDLRSLFLVKIDVEGAEGELFEGRAEWLQKPALVIIELHDWLLPWQGTSRSLFRKLGENNFDVVIKGENLLLFKH